VALLPHTGVTILHQPIAAQALLHHQETAQIIPADHPLLILLHPTIPEAAVVQVLHTVQEAAEVIPAAVAAHLIVQEAADQAVVVVLPHPEVHVPPVAAGKPDKRLINRSCFKYS
jgi:hypothetical protein